MSGFVELNQLKWLLSPADYRYLY